MPAGQPHPPGVGPRPGSPALVQLQNRKSEWVTQALRAHAQAQLPGLSRGAGAAANGEPSRARRTSGTRRADPFPAPCPLLPHQSRRVDSGGTVGPKTLCAFPEGSIRLRGRLERRWRRERRIQGLEIRRGNDPRTALGSERVPRVHFHLEQAERPSGVTGLPISPSQ